MLSFFRGGQILRINRVLTEEYQENEQEREGIYINLLHLSVFLKKIKGIQLPVDLKQIEEGIGLKKHLAADERWEMEEMGNEGG